MGNGLIMDYGADNTVHVIGIALRRMESLTDNNGSFLKGMTRLEASALWVSERFRNNWQSSDCGCSLRLKLGDPTCVLLACWFALERSLSVPRLVVFRPSTRCPMKGPTGELDGGKMEVWEACCYFYLSAVNVFVAVWCDSFGSQQLEEQQKSLKLHHVRT